MLWIDGVGGYLLCLGQQVLVGGPRTSGIAADVCLLANLSRHHATLRRDAHGYILEAHSEARVNGRIVENGTTLNDGARIELGNSVHLHFRLPTPLSGTATLEFASSHRPAQSVDSIVLLDETCLMGPATTNHIPCADWSETVVLFHKQGQFYCKSANGIFVDDKLVHEPVAVALGEIVSGHEFRFRIEAAK